METQEYLFDTIRKNNPDISLAKVIAEILGREKDAAYQRINGKVRLSIDELEKICKYFNLSMDEILNHNAKHNIMFKYSPISDKCSHTDCITKLSDKFSNVALANSGELICSAHDIPFYHFMQYTELAMFRVYAWYNTLNSSVEPFHKFLNSSENERLMSKYKNAHDNYMNIPSKEIWTQHTVDSTLWMLKYFNSIEAFKGNNDLLILIIDQLVVLLDTVKQYATDGYKGDNKTLFALYVCHVDVENNLIMLRQNDEWSCITKLYAINNLVTGNKLMCNDMLKWINSRILKSIIISGNSAQVGRLTFFNILNEKVQNLKNSFSA